MFKGLYAICKPLNCFSRHHDSYTTTPFALGSYSPAQGTRASFKFEPIDKLTPSHMNDNIEIGHLSKFDAFSRTETKLQTLIVKNPYKRH